MMSLSNLSIFIRPTPISRSSSQNWMNSFVLNTSRRAVNWRNGCAGLNSHGEHWHDGILLGLKFARAAESGPGNYSPTCDVPESNGRGSQPLCLSLHNSKWTTDALRK